MAGPDPEGRVERHLLAHGVRRIDLASRSGAGLDTLKRIDRGEIAGLKLGTLVRVAVALGVAPVVLAPELATTPRAGGLIAAASSARATAARRAAALKAAERAAGRDDYR